MPPALGPKMCSSLRPVSQRRSLNDQGITITPAEPLGIPSSQPQRSHMQLSKEELVKNGRSRLPGAKSNLQQGKSVLHSLILVSLGPRCLFTVFPHGSQTQPLPSTHQDALVPWGWSQPGRSAGSSPLSLLPACSEDKWGTAQFLIQLLTTLAPCSYLTFS